MSTETPGPDDASRAEVDEAATDAAQNVVDEVTSWEYSGERETIESELDEGLEAADVRMDDAERERVVDEIDDVKQHEDEGSPRVHPDRVSPADD
ncbi:hypothetical protein [Phycicoccus flavus]|uniref:hypothetical protein n=1 Tax=Phycicoccus flavus TaxID=2502783 RepID=UPI000FEBB5A9|nr:hypothetical protein [Phycicoccus flavus]NHA68178.1 hypothetical protein [Phycicoccus flavus]